MGGECQCIFFAKKISTGTDGGRAVEIWGELVGRVNENEHHT